MRNYDRKIIDKISVIVAAYNIEKYIERCIISIRNQTYSNIEIIIVNDGSTDNTLMRVEAIKKVDDRVVVIDSVNKGLIEARKKGFNCSCGEYVLFVDGDDWLELNCLEILLNKAKDGQADIVLYNTYRSWEEKKITFNTFNNIEVDSKDPLKSLLLGDIMPGLVFKFIRSEYIKTNNIQFPRSVTYAEDLAASVSLFIKKPKISLVEDYLYNYYQRNDSITRQITSKVLDVGTVMEFINEKLNELELQEIYRKEFEFLIYMHLYEYRFCDIKRLGCYAKEINKMYRSWGLNLYNNQYIMKFLNKNPISYRIRANSYNYSYNLGRTYDFIRNIMKKE